ncbi:MAG: DUF3887 domain-containing protein [Clostridia bacterium]
MKKFARLFCLTALVIFLIGCSANKLAESFDEKQVKLAAETAIQELNAGNYQDFTDKLVREDVRAALSAEVLENASKQILGDAGEFEAYLKEDVAGARDKATKEDYAVVTIAAKYANKIITYTISFDLELEIVGFYLK